MLYIFYLLECSEHSENLFFKIYEFSGIFAAFPVDTQSLINDTLIHQNFVFSRCSQNILESRNIAIFIKGSELLSYKKLFQ